MVSVSLPRKSVARTKELPALLVSSMDPKILASVCSKFVITFHFDSFEAGILRHANQQIHPFCCAVFDKDLDVSEETKVVEALNGIAGLVAGDAQLVTNFQAGIRDDRVRVGRTLALNRNPEDSIDLRFLLWKE